MEKCCAVCGAPLPPSRRKYCSDACCNAAQHKLPTANSGKPRKLPFREITCIDCGVKVVRPVKCKRCQACQDAKDRANAAIYAARRRAGKTRKMGSIDLCKSCGKPYVVTGSLQRYCKACAETAVHENIKAATRALGEKYRADPEKREQITQGKRRVPAKKVCAYCKNEFMGTWSGIYCSESCRKRRSARITRSMAQSMLTSAANSSVSAAETERLNSARRSTRGRVRIMPGARERRGKRIHEDFIS